MRKRILFACDLDNTLLVSHRYRQTGDICVEINQGKEQSFMTKRAIALLRQVIRKVDFVPVTTRSIEQYQRIRWPEGCEPELAVTTNGAVLLRQGGIDEDWVRQVRPKIDVWREEMQLQHEKWSLSKDFIRCRIVDDSYLFLYCDEDINVRACADACRMQSQLEVAYQGRKIYLLPPGLGKGDAVVLLKERLQSCYVCAAGDSTMDVSMLKVADKAYAESFLSDLVGEFCLVKPEGPVFSEWLLEKLIAMQPYIRL